MDITIESIDASAMKPLGFTQLPSYPVRFSSALVSGAARLVPFGDDASEYFGRTLYVELAQDRVSGFERAAPPHFEEAMVALEEQGSFQVHGRIASARAASDSCGSVVVTAVAGAAAFFLSDKDFADESLQEGDAVTFRVHGLSFWDEQI